LFLPPTFKSLDLTAAGHRAALHLFGCLPNNEEKHRGESICIPHSKVILLMAQPCGRPSLVCRQYKAGLSHWDHNSEKKNTSDALRSAAWSYGRFAEPDLYETEKPCCQWHTDNTVLVSQSNQQDIGSPTVYDDIQQVSWFRISFSIILVRWIQVQMSCQCE
jgi:hypothetical protein